MTDGDFIQPGPFTSLENGTWAAHLKARNISLLLSECQDEHFAFATWHSLPEDEKGSSNTMDTLLARLSVDYPRTVISTLLNEIYLPGPCATLKIKIRKDLVTDLNTFFGYIYADIQVHFTQRGFTRNLYEHGAGHLVRRCVVNWRAKRADMSFTRDIGVTHGSDTALWF